MSKKMCSHHYELSCSGERSSRSDFWRHISWGVGDKHANRICWLVDIYCRIFGLDPANLQVSPRG